LANRQAVYQRAKLQNPERWSRNTKQRTTPEEVTLNKKLTSKIEKNAA